MAEPSLPSDTYHESDLHSTQEPVVSKDVHREASCEESTVIHSSEQENLNARRLVGPLHTLRSNREREQVTDSGLTGYPDGLDRADENKGKDASENIASLVAEGKAKLSPADLDNAVALFRQVIDNHQTLQPDSMKYLASTLSIRFIYTNQMQDWVEFSTLGGRIVRIFDDQVATDTNIVARQEADTMELAKQIFMDFQKLASLHVLNNSIFLIQQSLKYLPATHPNRVSALTTLANGIYTQFYSYNTSGLDNSLSTLQAETIWQQSNMLYKMCCMLVTRFAFAGETPDLYTALGWISAVNSKENGTARGLDAFITSRTDNHAPETTSNHEVQQLTNRGILYLERFQRLGEMRDVEKAVSILGDAIQMIPDGHADKPGHLSNLGTSYLHRFERTGDLQDVDHAISNHQRAVQSTPSGHTDLPRWFNNLGNSYARRFQHTGELQDIGHAISNHQNAVQSTPSGHPDHPACLNNLGHSYWCRFKRTGDIQDINYAISNHQSAIQSTPSGHGNLPPFLNNLGNSYLGRFEHTGNLQDIDHAISNNKIAVQSTPTGHTNLPMYLTNLGNSYLGRFKRTGELQDIDYAISNNRIAVQSTPSGHANLPMYLNNLGNSYLCRFEHTGDLQDIDNAISNHQNALQSAPSGHTNLPSWFNNLGASYFYRFKRTGNLQDLDNAISNHQNAVQSAPSSHTNLPSWFNNLGSSYMHRFERTGDFQDIGHAISNNEMAVQSTPSGHADLPLFLTNLGNSYLSRFEHTGDLQDIDRAIFNHQNAVQRGPSGHTDLPMWVNNLGNSYLRRSERTGELQDIDCAISHHQIAIKSAPSGHANLPTWLNNLGNSYLCRFQHTQYLPDVQNSLVAYRQAAEANGAPSMRLQSSKQAAMLSSVHDSPHCLIDLAFAVSLLSEVAGLEQTIHHRHGNLQGHSDFVGLAVAVALRHDKPDLALEWLEQGRCLVWNQINQLRTPIEDLHVTSPLLASRFIQVARDLEFHGTRSFSSLPSTHQTLAEHIRLQDETRNHTLITAEYKQLLEEIRALPDFHDFLQPPQATNLLSSLPSDGLIVIFNFHEIRCDALALIPEIEDPVHIPLEKFSLVQAEELQKKLQSNLLELRGALDGDRMPCRVSPNPSSMSFVLKELWYKVIQPVLEAVGYSTESRRDPSDRRRIWWCPTGPLAFLPLHAAGIYGSDSQARQCVSDFVVSSYTPNVRSLNEKFKVSPASSKSPSLVIVSQPNTPGLPSIPYTKTETHDLKKLMDETTVKTLLLVDSEATRDKVKTEMQSHSWAHFACHGVQDISQPLNSGLCLHDGRLELLEIMKQQIPNLDLAFLSACQTSTGDRKLSEEVVHLAAGMLAAGYRGVVGTMWSISDRHGPEFAMEFYQYLLQEKGSGGFDSAQAAYALDHATRKVRERLRESDAGFLAWVPYVHFGY